MNKWTISKEIDFCYGHRVWNQTLNKDYSIDSRCVCRHLHGHQGKIVVRLESTSLEAGMVTDFKHLNWFKKFVDETLDHKFIIDMSDPMFKNIVPQYDGKNPPLKLYPEGYSIINPNLFKMIADPNMIDLMEGFVVVGFVPTSENLSRWLFGIVENKMSQIGVQTSSVLFCETPKTSSLYES